MMHSDCIITHVFDLKRANVYEDSPMNVESWASPPPVGGGQDVSGRTVAPSLSGSYVPAVCVYCTVNWQLCSSYLRYVYAVRILLFGHVSFQQSAAVCLEYLACDQCPLLCVLHCRLQTLAFKNLRFYFLTRSLAIRRESAHLTSLYCTVQMAFQYETV